KTRPIAARQPARDEKDQEACPRARQRSVSVIDLPTDAKHFPQEGRDIDIQNPSGFHTLVGFGGSAGCVEIGVELFAARRYTLGVQEFNNWLRFGNGQIGSTADLRLLTS